jgi:protein SCO1
MVRAPLFFSIFIAAFGCGRQEKLPILGPMTVLEKGNTVDTLYHSIPNFSLFNQNGKEIGVNDLRGNIFVADFFFTTCPSICPIMKTQMLRINERFINSENFKLVSISIDPRHDSVEVLKEYSERLGVEGQNWSFLTGELDDILTLAQKGFLVSAAEDSAAPGGYIHSGAFILVDPKLRIRGFYDGTKEEKVDLLMRDIGRLQKENKGA